ncbi:MAG TPA: MFS transporter [Candidatus Binataceae bacterium]|nr:MFS transporter [Candidatus Binataceae bacterium]
MTQRERQGWLIVASLWVTLFIIFGGGYNCAGVFLPPLIKQFGWSRAQLSTLQGSLAISAGISAPLIGWLLDRIEARVVMVVGAALAGAAYLFASQVHSYAPMLGAYLLLGLGIGAATLLPAALVVSNWFAANRGLALGLTISGTAVGGAGMTLVANAAIARHGWRGGYVALAIPMIVIAIPIVILMVKSRPPQLGRTTQAEVDPSKSFVDIPGLELSEAARTRSFWMICATQFFYAFVSASAGLHLITYLIGKGYTPLFAAKMMSLALLLTATGKLIMGFFADRVSARSALVVNFLLAAVGIVLMFNVADRAYLAPFVIIFGLTLGAPLVLLPMLTADSMGLKRFGSIAGATGVCQTIGAAVGPILTGKIYDVTGSYSLAFDLFIVACICGVITTLSVMSLETEQSRLEPVAATA